MAMYVTGEVLGIFERGKVIAVELMDRDIGLKSGVEVLYNAESTNGPPIPKKGEKVKLQVRLSHGNKEFPKASLWVMG